MGSKIWASRYHDFSAGHRVVGHENKCRHLHGHNYRVHFKCSAEKLDGIGRVIDFGVIKEKLCMWVENNWDHKFLAWDGDTEIHTMYGAMLDAPRTGQLLVDSIVWTAFNPTAENMADFLLNEIGPQMLQGTGVTLEEVVIEETRKCLAGAKL